MRNGSFQATVATMIVATGLLTGCAGNTGADATGAGTTTTTTSAAADGIAGLDAAGIVDRATAALEEADSYNVSGEVDRNGKRLSVDITVSGTDLVGNVTVGKGRVELLRARGKNYVRPDEAFWAQSTRDAAKATALRKTLGEKWAVVPDTDATFGDLFNVADGEELLATDAALTKGDEGEIRGTPVIAVQEAGVGTLYVATDGEPYPIRLQLGDKVDDGASFSAFGAGAKGATPPVSTQVIAINTLMGSV